MGNVISEIQAAVMDGEAQLVQEKTQVALAIGIKPKAIIKEGLLPGMNTIERGFREFEFYIPDVLMSSRAMKAGLYVLKPVLTNVELDFKGRIVIGTVAGDLHDIGKSMVSMILQSAGYEVIDIGIDVPTSGFISAVQQYKPDILALSSLLTTTMGEQREVIVQLKKECLREQVKVLVGGGSITPEFAFAIGADAYSSDCFHSITAAERLLKGEVGFFVA